MIALPIAKHAPGAAETEHPVEQAAIPTTPRVPETCPIEKPYGQRISSRPEHRDTWNTASERVQEVREGTTPRPTRQERGTSWDTKKALGHVTQGEHTTTPNVVPVETCAIADFLAQRNTRTPRTPIRKHARPWSRR